MFFFNFSNQNNLPSLSGPGSPAVRDVTPTLATTNLLLKHIKMGFGDVSTAAGVKALNDFLAERAYVEGFVPSQVDVAVFEAMGGKAPGADMAHALRYVFYVLVIIFCRAVPFGNYQRL